jgi:hypothetical protein
MALAPAALLAAMALAPQAAERLAPPPAEEIAGAIAVLRFDDSCVGPGPDDGCPVISTNWYRVRNPRCRLATDRDRDRYSIQPGTAFVCRFESGIVAMGSRAMPRRWRRDQAVMYPTGATLPAALQWLGGELSERVRKKQR